MRMNTRYGTAGLLPVILMAMGDFWRANMARGGGSWSRLPIGNWHLYRDFDLITFAAAE